MFIALKPCSFCGIKFRVGEILPAGMVKPEMAKRLIAMGQIAEIPETEQSESETDAPETEQSESETDVPEPAKKSRAKGKKSGDP